jgi:hypothetical protein
VIIKLYLLVKRDVQEKFFKKLRDLEIMIRSYHVKNTKINWIIEDLRKTTGLQEISILGFYLFMQIGYCCVADTDNNFLYLLVGNLYGVFNCFFLQILIFLKMNMEFVRRLQNHLNQVLANLQKLEKKFIVEDFIRIHLKIRRFLAAFNEAFGFIFLMVFVVISGSMIPEIYKSILTLAQFNPETSIKSLGYIILNFIWVSFSYYHLGRFAFECEKMDEEVIFCVIL